MDLDEDIGVETYASRYYRQDEQSSIFASEHNFNFDTDKHNIYDILNEIHLRPGMSLIFRLTDGKNISYGPGTTRHVYSIILNQLFDNNISLLVKHNNFFANINYSNIFWANSENINAFVMLIVMAWHNKVVLPFHFNPILLELIYSNNTNIFEQLYFLKYYDYDLYSGLIKVTDDDIEEDTSYKTRGEYIRSIFSKNLNVRINELIRDSFEFFIDEFCYHEIKSIITLDTKLSGKYIITADDVLSITKLSKDKYFEQWAIFIHSLCSIELEKFLILIGNTTDLSRSYIIIIDPDMRTDINISTCTYTVSINEKLFISETGLDILKAYLINGQDKIADEVVYHNSNNMWSSDNTYDDGEYDPFIFFGNRSRVNILPIRSNNHNVLPVRTIMASTMETFRATIVPVVGSS